MNHKPPLFVIFVALAVTTVAAQSPPEVDSVQATAEIRIDLPEGSPPVVAVEPADRRVLIELPRGAGFPLDFASSSGGLIRGGEVTRIDGGRVRLELELAQGLLDRVEYYPDALVLRFASRYAALGDGDAQGQYTIGPQDRLRITVHNRPELTSTLTVSDHGSITAPLVGDVRAEGMTARQLAAQLTEQLGRNFLVDPQVFVEVEDFRSKWVMVSGEVRLPGRVPLKGGTRLKEVLSEAGGFGENAGEVIRVSRRGGADGDYQDIVVDRHGFESGAENPVLQPGDIVDVPRAAFCYIQGEVRSPSRVRIERGMTLLKAISLVGGFTDWANKKEIKIIHGTGAEAREQVVNFNRIVEGKEPDPVLTGNEVVVVKRRFF
jgi:polysaccharide export outer membrane protein